jgi:hypothetical protein
MAYPKVSGIGRYARPARPSPPMCNLRVVVIIYRVVDSVILG